MGGHDAGSNMQFTGIQKYFNSYTIIGRRNYVLATYGAVIGIALLVKFWPKKKSAETKE